MIFINQTTSDFNKNANLLSKKTSNFGLVSIISIGCVALCSTAVCCMYTSVLHHTDLDKGSYWDGTGTSSFTVTERFGCDPDLCVDQRKKDWAAKMFYRNFQQYRTGSLSICAVWALLTFVPTWYFWCICLKVQSCGVSIFDNLPPSTIPLPLSLFVFAACDKKIFFSLLNRGVRRAAVGSITRP